MKLQGGILVAKEGEKMAGLEGKELVGQGRDNCNLREEGRESTTDLWNGGLYFENKLKKKTNNTVS